MDRAALASHLLTKVQVQQQLERELLPTGIHGFDSLTGGLPRGAITEIYGPASCGKQHSCMRCWPIPLSKASSAR